MGRQTHLTLEERYHIARFVREGYGVASLISFARCTLSNSIALALRITASKMHQ
jgi:IS30 family transposase